jgi:acyl-coenzyme A synthetase/AMP-(fatty) acid ligase
MTQGFTGELPPARLNLARYCIAASARHAPNKVALTIADGTGYQRLTYAEIEDAVLRIASAFDLLGLSTGDRVFLRMGNSFDYAAVFFAANAAGLVPVPASSMLSASEAAYMIEDSGAAAVVHDGSLELPPLPEIIKLVGPGDLKAFKAGPRGTWADTAAKQPAYMVYTSGTSGLPKGVLHAQRAVWGRRPMYQGWYGIGPDDVMLHTGAFNWTYTLGTGLFDPWANGASTIVYTGPRDRGIWLKLIAELQPTIMASVPALYRQLLADGGLSPEAMGQLRHGLTAGEAISPQLMQQWRETTGIPLYEALGMSEISTYVSSSPTVPTKPGSPGKPQEGRSVVVLRVDGDETPLLPGETGLIAVHRSDPGMMLGYWNKPEENEQVWRGDWFIGGDLGRFDDDGYLWYEGRNDDVMTSFGYRISPLEVENALMRHPAVLQAGVTEVEFNPGMRLVTAFVIKREHARVTETELIDFASQSLARYKVPKQVFFVDALPHTPNGKVVRKALASLLNQRKDHANDD